MSRKVFISVLGTGMYEKCKYVKEEFISSDTHFVQHATLEAILNGSEWSNNDLAIILLTEKAKAANWDESITKRDKAGEEIPYVGLQKVLKEMNLPFRTEGLFIPEGKDEKEMWEIFDRLFNKFEEGDELYFDLTHSFRYLPMLVLVLGNYAKFLKKVTIKYISYGNYEARNREKNEAPLVDLLTLTQLQDWTFSCADYLENGNVKKLSNLCLSTATPILKRTKGKDNEANLLRLFAQQLESVIEEQQTCRGISIVKGESIKKLKSIIEEISSNIQVKPLRPVFEKIKESIEEFDEHENVKNGFAAAKWCLDNGLYQQAVTIFHENIVTYICKYNDLNWEQEKYRECVNSAFEIYSVKIEEKNWKIKSKVVEEIEEKKEVIRKLISLPTLQKIAPLFSRLKEIRNDFNHAGMRNNPKKASHIKKILTVFLKSFYH